MLTMLLVTFYKYRQGDFPEGPGSRTMMACLIAITIPSAVGSMRFDHGDGWDLPWRGLRVPEVQMGGSSPVELYHSSKTDHKKKSKSGKRRSRGRNRSSSRGGKTRRTR